MGKSDPSIATVSTSGLVTAITPGETTITVSTTDGNKTASCDVTVTEPTATVQALLADLSTLNLSTDETSNPITLTATYTDGSTEDVTDSATWTSKDSSIATVDATEGSVTVTGVAIGSTTVTGTFGGKTATINVTVTMQPDNILVQPESVSVIYGKTQAVKIYAVYADDSKVDITQSVTLVSDDPNTASITKGIIKGISVGDTVVRGTYLGLDIEIPVTVTPPVTKLSADLSVLNLSIDGTETIDNPHCNL